MLATLSLLLALSAGETDAPRQPEKPKKVCREAEQAQLGSHIRAGRRCLTPDEWRIEDERRDMLPPTMRVTPDQGDGIPRPERPPL
jgi:hypothetical protein